MTGIATGKKRTSVNDFRIGARSIWIRIGDRPFFWLVVEAMSNPKPPRGPLSQIEESALRLVTDYGGKIAAIVAAIALDLDRALRQALRERDEAREAQGIAMSRHTHATEEAAVLRGRLIQAETKAAEIRQIVSEQCVCIIPGKCLSGFSLGNATLSCILAAEKIIRKNDKNEMHIPDHNDMWHLDAAITAFHRATGK